jgi:hypothetical protein
MGDVGLPVRTIFCAITRESGWVLDGCSMKAIASQSMPAQAVREPTDQVMSLCETVQAPVAHVSCAKDFVEPV